jgi:hypothetical protein
VWCWLCVGAGMSASDSFTLHIDDHYRVNRKRPEKVVSWAGWVAGIFR